MAPPPEAVQMPSDKPPESMRFQLIPFSDIPGRSAVGEVLERRLKDGRVMRFGRQVIKDGQPAVKGNKKATEVDAWFTSKVVSRLHAEMWYKDGTLYIKDIGSSSGTFLNKMRLSPCGKESRPYPIKEGDVIQLGMDFKGKSEDVYKAMIFRIGFFDQSWVKAQKKKANPVKFNNALSDLLAAANPYATGNEEQKDRTEPAAEVECCICISAMSPYQALFISPCSHCYHFKCVASLIRQSPMFQCPLCRQVANLTASVSTDSLNVPGTNDNEAPDILPGETEPRSGLQIDDRSAATDRGSQSGTKAKHQDL
ncbi:SMAD/FHA domain-containing protein [Gorgonomyces haynaldii]|nr:SMAD/FHA domain-containing protein [Gorgonomyces haynaldii]